MKPDVLTQKTHQWTRTALFTTGCSWGMYYGMAATPEEISVYLQARWYVSHNRCKISIELNRERSKDFWLSDFSLGGINPFRLSFPGADSLTEEQMDQVEDIIKLYLPAIKLIRCYFCEERIVLEESSGQWFCAECLKSLPIDMNRDQSGFVYIFGSGEAGYYKIGASVNPSNRVSSYRKALPFEVEILHRFPADDKFKAEAEIHRLFKSKKAKGEWFQLSSDDLEKLMSVKGYMAGKWVE